MTQARRDDGVAGARGRGGGADPDAAAFLDFVRTTATTLSRLAYLLTGTRADAEDLVQETLVKLCRRPELVLGADAPSAYACRALSNQFLSGKRRRSSSEIVTEYVGDRPLPGDSIAQITDRADLRAQLAALPERQRVAIVLRFYRDADDDEIAAALGARPGTVRSLISRGLATMRGSTSTDDLPSGGTDV